MTTYLCDKKLFSGVKWFIAVHAFLSAKSLMAIEFGKYASVLGGEGVDFCNYFSLVR
jgi:uncharacterized membrane protein (DUF441 family)